MDYDICDPSIRCGADKVGAEVFPVHLSKNRVCRVLAFTMEDAERLARDHSARNDGAETDHGPTLFDF